MRSHGKWHYIITQYMHILIVNSPATCRTQSNHKNTVRVPLGYRMQSECVASIRCCVAQWQRGSSSLSNGTTTKMSSSLATVAWCHAPHARDVRNCLLSSLFGVGTCQKVCYEFSYVSCFLSLSLTLYLCYCLTVCVCVQGAYAKLVWRSHTHTLTKWHHFEIKLIQSVSVTFICNAG